MRVPASCDAARINGGGGIGANAAEYAVAPDGRFLIDETVEDAAAAITILLNPQF